ncbi:hypothetical protein MTO96_005382 [Rhipicephalus appendiculatus]
MKQNARGKKLIEPRMMWDGAGASLEARGRPLRTSLSSAAAHRLAAAGSRRGVAGLGPETPASAAVVTLGRHCIEDVGSRRELSLAERETLVCL